MTRALMLLWLGAGAVLAQPFSVGVKGGVPFTDFVSATQSSNSYSISTINNRYIVGPMAELRLPFGLGIEVDALYRHYSFSIPADGATTSAWEFPLLAKYHFKTPIAQPYVEAGIAWDKLQGLNEYSWAFSNALLGTYSQASSLHKSTVTGFAVGGGIDVHALLIHIAPELRYTRWGAQHFLDPNGFLSSVQNQAEFLVGITF